MSSINDALTMLAPNDKIKRSISKIITDFITHKKNVLLSFSVLLTMFYSSNGMMSLMNNFEKRLPGFKRRNGFQRRGYAILLTLMLVVIVLLALSFLILQTWFAQKVGAHFVNNLHYWKMFVVLLIMVLILFSVCMIYKYGIAAHDRIRFFNPGAITATALILLLTSILFYAVNNLVNYDKIYGSIGTLIVFMLWINFMAQVVLIGFELNASIIVNRTIHQDE